MTVFTCGEKDCNECGRWLLVLSPAGVTLCRSLCTNHWKLLRKSNWLIAACYTPAPTPALLRLTS
jgi:hypothetical protein